MRTEICDTISFTRKETDIYKIHQSGDLANLDGLDDASLKQLPSLLKLRDSLYSAAFRNYLSAVTGSGPLSGLRTDMAVVRVYRIPAASNQSLIHAECVHPGLPSALPR